MLILILIDVQCSQKVVFSFEKSSFLPPPSPPLPIPYHYLENPIIPFSIFLLGSLIRGGGILAKITKNCMRIGTTVPLDEGHVNLWEEPIS